ncbi:ArsR family transcriptional regulator [Haladaptatus sp. AB618]|uniref:DUF7344 domain-containing protein n=1 Tax=Haladaptatus sp. AB618 TaxID=2934173 RepID=UPI00209C5520|nr:ArsR family transcriptional regulator [Haladaptatus sp. AB618]MCO8256722.1 ArsR family transcriptional regulator [Haladaptatus sp. AB618]
MSHATTSPSLNTMLGTLGNSYRRRILIAVLNQNPRAEDEFTLDKSSTDEMNDAEIKSMKIQLHHIHLPKLADAGYIDWDPDTGAIRRGPNIDEIAPLLTLMRDHADELPDDWP